MTADPNSDTLPQWLSQLLDLRGDQAEAGVIDQTIRAGVGFRGTNLWLLVFAMVIASIGLNVNSTAVIIGAMLISPLMGPIMGAGYGAAIGDYPLLRRSLWNLGIAAAASVLASALYFSISPLSTAHSELLARTNPTIWDVGIALFGGLAGIIGLTRKEKSNVLPGVAIATALMPPLCTAGYGLATFEFRFFFGAFYLFFINSVFIAIATLVMVRVMHLPHAAYVDQATRRRAQAWIAAAVFATALPSLYFANQLVQNEVFQTRAQRFLADAVPADGGMMVAASEISAENRTIRLTLLGDPLSADTQADLQARLANYGLPDTRLLISQHVPTPLDLEGLRQKVSDELYRNTVHLLDARTSQLAELEAQIATMKTSQATAKAVAAELRSLMGGSGETVITTGVQDDGTALVVALVQQNTVPADLVRLEAWLQQRTGAGRAIILIRPPS